jgi:hypothetical protein
MKTMMVVIVVSRRLGQVTFSTSERTSCMNLNGLIFAMWLLRPNDNNAPPHGSSNRPNGKSVAVLVV